MGDGLSIRKYVILVLVFTSLSMAFEIGAISYQAADGKTGLGSSQ